MNIPYYSWIAFYQNFYDSTYSTIIIVNLCVSQPEPYPTRLWTPDFLYNAWHIGDVHEINVWWLNDQLNLNPIPK